MTIFQIIQNGSTIRVEAAAATEMSFEIDLADEVNYFEAIKDIFHIANDLLTVDAAMMEMFDGADVEPGRFQIIRLQKFARKYRAHLRNVQTDLLEG